MAIERPGRRHKTRGAQSSTNDRAETGKLDAAALYRLMAWLSPAYPIGAFSYSGGIEWAVEAGDITNATTLQRWLTAMIGNGGGFCDARVDRSGAAWSNRASLRGWWGIV